MHTYITKTKIDVSVVTVLHCVDVRRTSYTSYWHSTYSNVALSVTNCLIAEIDSQTGLTGKIKV
jgi:hypothetical protein